MCLRSEADRAQGTAAGPEPGGCSLWSGGGGGGWWGWARALLAACWSGGSSGPLQAGLEGGEGGWGWGGGGRLGGGGLGRKR